MLKNLDNKNYTLFEKYKGYKLTKYYVSSFLNDDSYILFSCISGSLIKLEKRKYEALVNLDLDIFEEQELEKLIKMGFFTKRNELKDLEKIREHIVTTRYKQSLGLTILTTTACNARCSYCFEKGIVPSYLSKENANKIINFILKNYNEKPLHISWFGGEPLLNYDIINYICEKIISNGISFNSTMISNGYLFDKVSPEMLKLWNLKKVQITLDGVGAIYNEIKNYYGVHNAFDKVISNIHYLLKNNIKVVIRINYNPDNFILASNTIDWIYSTFGSNNKLLNVYCVNIFDHNVKHVNEIENNENNPYLVLTKKLIDYGYITDLKKLGFSMKRVFCGIYHNYFVINSDGNIYKCEHTCNDSSEIIGTIKNDKVDECMYQKWLDIKLPSKECETCNVLPCCQGNCKSLIKEYGLHATCIPIKKYGETLLKYFVERRGKDGNHC